MNNELLATQEPTEASTMFPSIPSHEQTSMLRAAGQSIAEMMLFNPAVGERVERMGEVMATAKCTIPQHLRGNAGDCTAIIMQAMRWGVDPYAVAQKTHIINGVMGYEAQLINAILLKNAPIVGRPHYEWFGDWEKILGKFNTATSQKGNEYQKPAWKSDDEAGLGVRITIQIKGQAHPTTFDLLLSQATVRNSTLWAADPRQQLAYLAIKRMARLYFPDVIAGVYTIDELEDGTAHQGFERAKDVTPPRADSTVARPSKAQAFAQSTTAKPNPSNSTPLEQPVDVQQGVTEQEKAVWLQMIAKLDSFDAITKFMSKNDEPMKKLREFDPAFHEEFYHAIEAREAEIKKQAQV